MQSKNYAKANQVSDLVLQKFYNDIKGPAWPNINTHNDFYHLPAEIQYECQARHNYSRRLQEIEDPAYWFGITAWVWQHNDLVYAPLGKCASTYHIDLLENTFGWEKKFIKDVDFDRVHAFGLIRHPLDRYLKGLTEWIYRYKIIDSFEGDLENNQTLRNIIKSVLIPDTHCMPFSMFYGDLLEKIHWIPMDIMSEQDTKLQIENFLSKHNYNIQLPINKEKLNTSSLDKINLYNTIKKLYPTKIELEYFYYLFANDLKFYRTLVEKFQSS